LMPAAIIRASTVISPSPTVGTVGGGSDSPAPAALGRSGGNTFGSVDPIGLG
jgi:hypothetical protein